ncbi:PAS domain S-box protein [Flavobacterium sp. RSP29]|uniref:PAS domain-containing sensor histidine kinase n=1 Tax=Flavobacterium sp. RSP29 TaxID=3401731 RepID=UPI003AAFFE2C
MSTLENNKEKKVFDTFDFKQEFNFMLSFVMELCDISEAFISIVDGNEAIVKLKIGCDFLDLKEDSLFTDSIIFHNKKIVVSDINKHSSYRSNLHPFSFFAGFPICLSDGSVVGALCFMDIAGKELSVIQLKGLDYAVLKIQSRLELWQQNQIQRDIINEKESQFQLFIDNSNQIFFELSLDGIITFASENWTTFLGYELYEIVGKNNNSLIHPEDLEMYYTYFNELVETRKNKNELVYRVLHKKGHYVWHSCSLKLTEKKGNLFYNGYCRDITEHIEAQRNLLQQKEFYEKILDQIPTDIAVLDINYKYIYLNNVAVKNEELRKFIIGKDDFEYAEHTGRDNAFAKNRRVKFMKALEDKQIIEWEDTIERKNGEKTYHIRKFAPIFRDDGSFEMMVSFWVDVTEKKKNQEEILKSRQLTSSIIQNVAVGIFILTRQYEIVESNKAASDMLGFARNQLLGKTPFNIHWNAIHLDGSEFFPEDFPVTQAISQLKPLKKIVMGIYRNISKDLIWILADAIPVFDEFGEFLYVICSFTDITSRIIAENKLKVINERFTYGNEATFDVLWDWNILTNQIFIGKCHSILFGHRFEDNIISRQHYESFVHPEDRAAYFKSLEIAFHDGIYRWSHEYRYLKADGTYSCVNHKGVIIRNDAGTAIRMIGAVQDITIEKKMKDELQQSEEQFKGAFQHSAVGIALMNLEGYYTEINERLCEILGYSDAEMKAMKFHDITYHRDLNKYLNNIKSLDSGKITHFSKEKRFIHKNKSIVWTLLSVSLVIKNTNERGHYIVQMIDITERKKIERENKLLIEEKNRNEKIKLNEVKTTYRLLADNTVDLVCLHNLDSSFQYVSPSVKKLLGYNAEALIGKLPREFIHPEDVDKLRNTLDDFINEMEDISVRLRFRNVEGNYFWFETKAALVKEKGIPKSFQSSTRDITQQIEAEEIVGKTLIQERELNELRNNLVSTISHEFRTPMTTIRASAELIAMYLEGYDFGNSIQVEKRINIITEEIDRIVELMNAVLTISKDDSGKTSFNPVKFDLKQVCIDVIESSYSSQNNKRKVNTRFEGDAFYVFADKKLMEYSIFNILNNAFKYSEGCGDIMLNLLITESTIVIEVIDFGIGIPDRDQSKLFNTFFRASNTEGFQGTGLGLYIVKTFVEKNSGTVQLESQLGKGTKVILNFPKQN